MLLQTAIQIERRKDDFAQLLFYGLRGCSKLIPRVPSLWSPWLHVTNPPSQVAFNLVLLGGYRRRKRMLGDAEDCPDADT
jgi:hypothetical protein